MHTNPLRVLDSKNPAMQTIIDGAPKLLDFLGAESIRHFEGVQAILKDAGIPYTIDARLVRGLDYYNLTVFEWITDRLGAQGTVCGGGRYDGLIEQIGGKPAPAAGFAMGVERLIALMRGAGEGGEAGEENLSSVDVYLVNQGEAAGRSAFRASEMLRDRGFSVIQHCGDASFKSQMKRADASGAAVAVIIGDDEAAAGEASVKPLREERAQSRVPLDRLADAVSDLLYGEEFE
jgi:histidyl-tRNA synthetase